MYPTHIFTSTDSTNRIASDLAKNGAQHGTAVLAEMQSKGRGRLDRSWYSPAQKGLYCSIIIRPRLSWEEYPKITLVAGLAVAQTLARSCNCPCSVKWPNDIYIRGRKLGGILTESSSFAGNMSEAYAVVGIGVNINNGEEDFAPEIASQATSIFLETKREYDIRAVFEAIRLELLKNLEIFVKKGFQEILMAWKEMDMLQGKMVRWLNPNGEIIHGRSQGPDHDGCLVIVDEGGLSHRIISGDILFRDQ